MLLLGGRHKGEPYTELADELRRTGRAVIAYGEAAPIVEQDLDGVVPVERLGSSFDEVVARARAARAARRRRAVVSRLLQLRHVRQLRAARRDVQAARRGARRSPIDGCDRRHAGARAQPSRARRCASAGAWAPRRAALMLVMRRAARVRPGRALQRQRVRRDAANEEQLRSTSRAAHRRRRRRSSPSPSPPSSTPRAARLGVADHVVHDRRAAARARASRDASRRRFTARAASCSAHRSSPRSSASSRSSSGRRCSS